MYHPRNYFYFTPKAPVASDKRQSIRVDLTKYWILESSEPNALIPNIYIRIMTGYPDYLNVYNAPA